MPAPKRAVGAPQLRVIAGLEGRMDAFERALAENRAAAEHAHRQLADKIDDLSTNLGGRIEAVAGSIGKPPIAEDGPTGIYKLVHELDGRVRPFEAMRHQWIGAAKIDSFL